MPKMATLDPPVVKQYAKALSGALIAAASAAVAAYGPDSTVGKAASVAVAFLVALGAVATVKNVLTPQQLLAQPNYAPAVAHPPMPVYDPGPNVTQSYINPQYTQDLEQRAAKPKPLRDPATGRYLPKQ